MKFIKNVLLIFIGFIGGIYVMLRGIAYSRGLRYIKEDFINWLEHLLLGYNTIKTKPYSRFERKRPYAYANYTQPSYNDYYRKSFEEDEEDEDE